MKNLKTYLVFLFIGLLFLMSYSEVNKKQPLTHDVYDSWKSIGSYALSNSGKWMYYLEVPQDGEGVIKVINPKKKIKYSFSIGYTGEGTDSERNAKPVISVDENFLVFLISPTKKEIDEHKKDKKTKLKELKRNLGIMHLKTGQVKVIKRVKSFLMPKENGGWLAYLHDEKEIEENEKQDQKKKGEAKEKSSDEIEKKKKYGTKLVLISLKDGKEIPIDSVMEYKFTKNGKKLFFAVSDKTKPETDGLYCFKTTEKIIKPLLKGKGVYKQIRFNKTETMFAFLSDCYDFKMDHSTFGLYGNKIEADKADLWVSHYFTKKFPKGMAVSDKSSIQFSDDGKIIMFGIKKIPEVKNNEKKVEKKAKFDLWHWKDPYPQPQQKIMAEKIRNNTWESVYFIKNKKFVKLADKDLPDLKFNKKGKVFYGNTNWSYAPRMSYFGEFNDLYLIDSKTGKKKIVQKQLFGRGGQISAEGKYMYWFQGKDWFVYNIKNAQTVNVTKDLNVSFTREDHDRPMPASSYGIAGWTLEDKYILIYDKYDIWKITPDGKNKKILTGVEGRKDHLSFRYINLDREQLSIDLSKPILLGTTNLRNMDSGFYEFSGDKGLKKLIFEKKRFSYPQKSKNGKTLLFSKQSVSEYPDLWISNLNFSNPAKITDLGSQTDHYIWPKSELIDFESSDGKPLKGILLKPENFDSNKKYPLMVYIYETMHTRLNSFRMPSPGSSINTSFYVSNGYIVWMPDIEYDTGYPGKDALKCVLPGIQLLINKGFIDKNSIGIQGHSWGGYQIAYMITQTNIFAAVEAGAPVSNMTSAYGGIRWGSGMVRQFQYEKTQSRLGDSLWKVPMRYFENSPVFFADKVQTPIMMMHNDEDGAVPWYQGIEYIMALRRLNKEAYMFNYNGEKHGLRKRINQKDWTIRMFEFFNHHLNGEKQPNWMKNGIKAWEKPVKKSKNK